MYPRGSLDKETPKMALSIHARRAFHPVQGKREFRACEHRTRVSPRGNRGTGRWPGGAVRMRCSPGAADSPAEAARPVRDPAHARPPADSRRPHLPLRPPALRARPPLPLCPARLVRAPGNAAPPPAPTGIIAAPSAAPAPPDRTPLRPPHRPRTRCGALRPGCGEAAAAESHAALARPVAPPREPRRRPSAATAASAEAGRLPPPTRLTPAGCGGPALRVAPPPAYATHDWSGGGGGIKGRGLSAAAR
ncbi:atherin-like [Rattus norvegicus]|uniref:atherin-like n=1 Tax=Rattus norvegicus TaxID=10116 RepID=UPI002FD7F678